MSRPVDPRADPPCDAPSDGGGDLRLPPPPAALRGRGTGWQVAHRFERRAREAFDDGWGALDQVVQATQEEQAEPPAPHTEVLEERAGEILAHNDSPDVPFEFSINPYRGCEHGCIYCYARPTHGYLNLSPGLDFETKIVAKVNAAERLRVALRRPSWRPQSINLGSATDAYQPVERRLRLTRGVLEVLHEAGQPVSIVTKSGGIVRDLDLLAEMAARRQVLVFISVTTLDNALSRILEPRATAPQRRLAAIRRLADAGVWVGVNVAPIIPFVNEPEIEQILAAAAQAGARSAHWTVVRLPWEVNPLFQHWLAQHFPDRAERVMARLREMRGGRAYDADFRHRMKGEGPWAQLIRQRVEKGAARVGLLRETPVLDTSGFCPPRAPQAVGAPEQGSLF
ncbi:PA0069 family radical SAM protein [Sphaerotilus microaerophilus]|uniref:Radical SAM protein n=1 Tax=Sphaerotilus microaerophilus TaxID=2914710 RepID=A0ABN6PMH5_9BURK|nr:PA0069 family radical SAM protein [Sphaerotilus sp. FB-5]BDI05257.1 radical SAM protein [Sphaerotilus sp. FB-5]